MRRRASRRYVYSMPDLYDVREKATLGSFSITTKTVKFVDTEYLVSVGEVADTVPAVCRDWLDIQYGKRLAKTDDFNRKQCNEIIRRFKPQLARPGVYADMIMVDIKSAYWQIVKRIGFNCTYHPLRVLLAGALMDEDDFLWSNNKTARAMLVASALPESTIWQWDGVSKVTSIRKYNDLAQPMLVAAVYDILHGIAADAHDILVYYNVDGGIIHRSHLPLWDEICQSWGIEYKIKAAGYALVRSVGSYKIGMLKTSGKNVRMREHDNMKPRNGWLRERFKKLSDRKTHIH